VPTHSNGSGYLSGLEREALLFPDRASEKKKTFSQVRMHDSGSVFQKMVGQEAELYDMVL